MTGKRGRPQPLTDLLLIMIGALIAYSFNKYKERALALESATDTPNDSFRLRKDSLLDITDPDHPTNETVIVAEGFSDSDDLEDLIDEALAENALHENDGEFFSEADPTNPSGTATALEPEPDDLPLPVSGEELTAAEAEVIAEAERIQTEAGEQHDTAAKKKHKKGSAKEASNEPKGAASSDANDDEPVVDNTASGTSDEEIDAAIEHALAESVDAESDKAAIDDALTQDVVDDGPATDADDDAAEPEAPPTWVSPVNGECPPTHMIKARFATGRYHEPGTKSYAKIVPDCCYATVEDAEADGFSKSTW